MSDYDTKSANLVVQESLKQHTKCLFNEIGIRFGDKVWAFPNNRKIFIGIKDYPMNDKTLSLVNRAIMRHDFIQKLRDNRVALVSSGFLIIAMSLFGFKACEHSRVHKEKTNNSCVINSAQDTLQFTKFISDRTKQILY